MRAPHIAQQNTAQPIWQRDVQIPSGKARLHGTLHIPAGASGIIVFAHGSGSSRFSPRNQYVAGVLHDAGLGTLLFDLLTPEEEVVDVQTRELRFDIALLATRLVDTTVWITHTRELRHLRIGYFGASTGVEQRSWPLPDLRRSLALSSHAVGGQISLEQHCHM